MSRYFQTGSTSYQEVSTMRSQTVLNKASFLCTIITCILGIQQSVCGATNDTSAINGPNSISKQQACDIKLNKITGQIFSLQHDDLTTLRMSLMHTKIFVNYGQFIGYPREDGSFEVDNLPPDSYVVEVTHPKFVYEPMRVDITSKGKIRARRVNHIQPALVQTLDYPLKFKPQRLHNYFTPRETWRIMDILLNPMVIMMVVPLVIIWLIPKMMSPQEVQAQRDNMQMPEYNVPELSEMMASVFGQQKQSGDGGSSQAITSGQPGTSGGGGGGKGGKSKRR